ncbi:hypothetical protein RP300_01664 [Oligella urethralis]|uniref:hypothetical protein n=1 Tax=Oligella urethralis TaxID=90245 RepID=UPI002958BB9E|nr:hypothetical protein [Oligella urethralis]WOS38099.1 hypothetical protein RP300_01664 [Oligella urethralis]
MEYIVTLVLFVYDRWWLSFPLLVATIFLIFSLEDKKISNVLGGSIVLFFLVQIVLIFFHHHLVVPLVNKYYGKFAIAEVVSVKEGWPISFVTASFTTEEGNQKTLSYTGDVFSTRGVYPVSKRAGALPNFSSSKIYMVPGSVGKNFIIKYLPTLPGEFIFMAELSVTDRQKICPAIQKKLSQLEQEQSVLRQKKEALENAVYAGLSDDEISTLRRKIRRGSDLTAEEQQYRDLSEETSLLGTRISSYRDLLEGDDYCQK